MNNNEQILPIGTVIITKDGIPNFKKINNWKKEDVNG